MLVLALHTPRCKPTEFKVTFIQKVYGIRVDKEYLNFQTPTSLPSPSISSFSTGALGE
jgi:hypothetical protein